MAGVALESLQNTFRKVIKHGIEDRLRNTYKAAHSEVFGEGEYHKQPSSQARLAKRHRIIHDPSNYNKLGKRSFKSYIDTSRYGSQKSQMAYKRRSYKKYPTRKRRIAYAARSLGVSRRPACELKCLDVEGTSFAPICTSVSLQVINVALPGSSFYQRVGNTIRMKSIHVRGFIEPIGTPPAGVGQDYVRMCIIYDRQPNGAYPTYSQIFTSYNNAGSTASTAWDFTNPTQFDRFLILRDKTMYIPPIGTGGAANITPMSYTDPQHKLLVNFYIKLPDLETRFNQAASGTISDITSGAIYLLAITQNNNSASAGFGFYFSTRLRYCD
jgi:hypothetical protein